ncbi:hypothetical protein CFOL_v3_30778 [Cephalotus follicularis]|uniref:Uncharacterized protein n=1 Tax=Cephalotus follicularis TaxID=3775 RepID=A0A1Q3D4G7_CEPFO|nr:hypothetical protein CFOL_v3_30778 [Cephalotus follicularis]
MGSCFSTCKPKKHFVAECNHGIQDKLVISQAPKTPKTPSPQSNKISPSPPSPTHSNSSISFFTNTTGNIINTCSSFSSASSVSSSKDRSFSNEFLWSCVKENPHIVHINSIKEFSLPIAATKTHAQKLDLPAKRYVAPQKLSIKQSLHGTTPQKRVRPSSPSTVTRQMSFRKEPDWLNSSYSLPSRTLRSPSPSRRFDAGNTRVLLTNTLNEICSKSLVGPKISAINSVSSCIRKENPRRISDSSCLLRPCMNREACVNRIGSKIDEVAVTEALSHRDRESFPFEDIDNPFISLDCFIFL